MELIYSMRRKSLKCEPPYFDSVSDPEATHPLCALSIANIIAFSSRTELTDSEGESWGGHVYVCDMDTPWDCHKVTSTVHPISALEWDSEGKLLLVATSAGEVSIFTQKDYLLNAWTSVCSTNFPGEHILGAVFFHNGRRAVLADKKADAPISERVQLLRCTPTLKGFGGVASAGALVVSLCGALGALCTNGDVVTHALPTVEHITSVALYASHTGSIVVGAAGRTRVRCSRVVLRRSPLALAAVPLPALCLPPELGPPASISWCPRDDTESLIVAGKTITMWKLTERAYPVHKLLSKGPVQGNTTPGGGQKTGADCFTTFVWQQSAAWAVEGSPVGCAVACAPHAPLAALAVTPRALLLLPHQKAHVITFPIPSANCDPTSAGATPPKKTKYSSGACLVGVAAGALGGAALVVDSRSQLHLIRLPGPHDAPTPLSIQHTANLLEYAMVAGLDPLDLLITLKPPALEALYDRITESFQRQPQQFQQYYYQSWLTLRIALCRCSPSQQASASWLCALGALQAGWAALGGVLRLDERADAALQALPALPDALDLAHPDHDKCLQALEAKNEAICEASAGGAGAALVRRALHIAGAVLAWVASSQRGTSRYELGSDPSALVMLRRVLAAGRGGRAVEPLLRPLARLGAGKTPPHDLVEECAALSAQLAAPRVWESLPRCCVSAPIVRTQPLLLEYGQEPEFLKYNPEPPVQCDTTPSPDMDTIRYMYLGGGAGAVARWRECGRCGARTLAKGATSAGAVRHPLHRAFDARFLASCRCGGKWTLRSNVSTS